MPILNRNALEFVSRSPEQTRSIGARLGSSCMGGEVIALEGDLGSGKTVLAQGIGLGWGATTHLTSPTFTFIRRHSRDQDQLYLYHIDLYRIARAVDVASLGLDDILGNPQAVCIVEWADRVPGIIPADRLWVKLRWLDDFRRSLTFEAVGERYSDLSDKLRKGILGL